VTNLKKLFKLVNDMYCRSVVNDVVEGGGDSSGRVCGKGGVGVQTGGLDGVAEEKTRKTATRRKGLRVVIEGEETPISHLQARGGLGG
jgi:hypothetical protein